MKKLSFAWAVSGGWLLLAVPSAYFGYENYKHFLSTSSFAAEYQYLIFVRLGVAMLLSAILLPWPTVLIRVLAIAPSLYVGWNGFVMYFLRNGNFGPFINQYSAMQLVLFLATVIAVFWPDLMSPKRDASDTR